MLFNSFVFIFVFLPPVLAIWWWPGLGRRTRLAVLTGASYVFYGYWDWRFTFLMLLSTLVDFGAGLAMERSRSQGMRRFFLVCSLAANLGLLGFFKYWGLLATSLNAVAAGLGFGASFPTIEVVLPVGISFYTFQTMSYSIDVYRRQVGATRDFLAFSAFVSMYPQLVAGPIVRYVELAEQIDRPRQRPEWEEIRRGVELFLIGLCKKVLLADAIGAQVDRVLETPDLLGLAGSWAAMVGFALQIYFDFSGYSDMAVGLGYLLGFRLPMNFNSPYKARNISEFWERWHISLSSWLRDYLYIPLGGSRKGHARTLRNLAITMFLGGLWHGANWTFVAWGLYHGVLLLGYHSWRRAHLPVPGPRTSMFLTFALVVVGWVFFRSDGFGMAGILLGRMFGLSGSALSPAGASPALLVLVGAGCAWCLIAPNSWDFRPPKSRLSMVALALMAILGTMRLEVLRPFLYFQF
ncbi:MAG: MBOAT family protein [Nitrospirae bacterium]|nr:MBOAT family protein [Nitrospirota bacterium]